MVRKHVKLKGFSQIYNTHNNNNKTIITKIQLYQRVTLRRQQQQKQQLTLINHKIIHENIKNMNIYTL